MTATAVARPGITKDGIIAHYPVQAAAAAIKAGYAIVVGIPAAAADVAGHAKTLVSTDYEDHRFVGVAEADADNSAGAAAAIDVPVRIEGAVEFVGSSLVDEDIGKDCWLTDNQTITLTPPSDASGFYAGRIIDVKSATRAIVKLPPLAGGRKFYAATTWDANTVDKRFFVATKPCRVVGCKATVTVAGTNGSAVTGMIEKVPSGTAIGSGTDILTATFDLKATANTVISPTLSATLTALVLSPNDCLALDVTGTLTDATGVVTVELEEI